MRKRPTCPLCGRKNLRSVGKHIRRQCNYIPQVTTLAEYWSAIANNRKAH